MIGVVALVVAINIVGFLLALYFKNKHFPQSWYEAALCVTASLMFSILAFDFLPHMFGDFTATVVCDHPHDHAHEHHHSSSIDWVKVAIFAVLLVCGNFFQVVTEKVLHKKLSIRFENGVLIFVMFLHSFSESSLLFDVSSTLNKSLLTGIILHSAPLAFVIANTILMRTTLKFSVIWFVIFLLAVPIGVVVNKEAHTMPVVFQWVSIFVTGMMMHVIWHLWESIKDKSYKSYLLVGLGLALGYGITLFHSH
jgi:hypothetical protein